MKQIEMIKPLLYSYKTLAMAIGRTESATRKIVKRNGWPKHYDGGTVFFVPGEIHPYVEQYVQGLMDCAA